MVSSLIYKTAHWLATDHLPLGLYFIKPISESDYSTRKIVIE